MLILDIIILAIILLQKNLVNCLISPPFWADSSKNPCASQPQGWQFVYWPQDKKCYKVFKVGFPCSETMELTPTIVGENIIPKCKCPPGTVFYQADSQCYKIFERGPCQIGEYFSPNSSTNFKSDIRLGYCKKIEKCPNSSQLFWPKTGKCYYNLTQGPCSNGKLLIFDQKEGLAKCHCNNSYPELQPYYFKPTESCHEFFTLGPCLHSGQLFLPGPKCGCHSELPHYHKETGQCYKLGDIGPCKEGHYFQIDENLPKSKDKFYARCMCKKNYLFWKKDGKCYRKYTQGPCRNGQFFVSPALCVANPCDKNQLYYPEKNTCYTIGSNGPCLKGQVITYDYESRPSIDGISYNGVCSCSSKNEECLNFANSKIKEVKCDHGKLLMNQTCHMMYTRGPCESDNHWLVPKRGPRWELWQYEKSDENQGFCECRPNFKEVKKMLNGIERIFCDPLEDNLSEKILKTLRNFFHNPN